jgi:hypothetical protein
MKKCLLLIAVVMALVCSLRADSVVQTMVVPTTTAVTSDQFTASGWLDKIEISQDSAETSTVVVATYDSAGTAIDTFANYASLAGGKVIRPRALGTTTNGTAIAAAVIDGNGSTTNLAGTVLSANYERIMIGGNVKAVVTGISGATNNVTVRIFYEPLKK